MQRHLVVGVHVDAFDDIDFAAGWPVEVDKPECGPQAAGVARHVDEVGDEEAAVICWIANQFDVVASCDAVGVEHGGVVDADVENAVAEAEHLHGLGDR